MAFGFEGWKHILKKAYCSRIKRSGFRLFTHFGSHTRCFPNVYIENGNVVGLDSNDTIRVSYDKNFKAEPTRIDNPELITIKLHHGHNNSIVNGIPGIGCMKGGEYAARVIIQSSIS